MELHTEVQSMLKSIGAGRTDSAGGLTVRSPIDGARIGGVELDTAAASPEGCALAAAFTCVARVPAPKRGELVRRFGEGARAQGPLGRLVSIEAGKILRKAWAKCRK